MGRSGDMPLTTVKTNTAMLAATRATVTGCRRAVKASLDSGSAAGGGMSAEALGYVTVALRQSGHTPLASPHESPANSRPQFLQFANGRAQPSAYANAKKSDDGTSVRLVFLTTNATQRHYLRHLSNLIPRLKCCATAAIVLLPHGVGPSGQSGRALGHRSPSKKIWR